MTTTFLIIVAVAVLAVTFLCLARRQKALHIRTIPARPTRNGTVVLGDREVRFEKPDGTSDSIAWNDIAEVGVLTTDEGPIQEDVFFMLLDRDQKHGCAIPQGAAGSDDLVRRLQALPGFDNARLIEAMGCTSNNRFVCWRRA